MFWSVFSALIYTPLYNALVFLIDVLPGGSVGLSIIILTIVVKILLFPLARQATRTQLTLKKIAPALEEIKKKYKDNQQEQVAQMLRVYKQHRVHPLSGVLVIFIQLPIVIGLYWVFYKGGLPNIHQELLYSFVMAPQEVYMNFLGHFNLSEKSLFLATIVAITQLLIGHITFEAPVVTSKPGESLKDDIMRSLHLQTKYVLPLMLGVFAYVLASAVALHWITGNIFTILQDILVKRRFRAIEKSEAQAGQAQN